MNQMIKRCFIAAVVLLLQLSLPLYAQQPTATNTNASKAFPAAFVGTWKGTMQWMIAGKATKEFAMQLIVQPTDTAGHYTWQIIYGDQGADNRPYILKPVDTALGHWMVDERDGIMLDCYVHGNSVHGAFTVQQATIVDNYRVEGDQLFVEFFTIKLNDTTRSGKGTDETPFVDSYRISSYQAGKLRRQ